MTFCIITHVVHTEKNGMYYAYAPYINEMNIWLKYVDKLIIVAPQESFHLDPIHTSYQHPKVEFKSINQFDTLSLVSKIKAVAVIPKNCWIIYKAMQQSDHIHLRCPGNMGLLGCFIQVFFPNKPKTAKYAGNWDPKSNQPLSYKIQKWILTNTFITKNMQVLVYGTWENQTKNVKPFFTATYKEKDKTEIVPKKLSEVIRFVFAGSLVKGKRPMYAIQIVEKLNTLGFNVQLDIYGEGDEREVLESYIKEKGLFSAVILHGNQSSSVLKTVYEKSHFLILPSESEGWPKVVAEAMFWGCLPIATAVSCVPNMLDFGSRGVLLSENLESDVKKIADLLSNQEMYDSKINQAVDWSRKYTIDTFENEIKQVLKA